VLKLLSETLNFKLRLNAKLPDAIIRVVLPNETWQESYKDRYFYENLKLDIKLEFYSDYGYERTDLFTTYHFYTVNLNVPVFFYFAVPPGHPYDAYDKLYLPFDLATWILTLLTFIIAFTTIFIVYCMHFEVRNFIFGENVKYPSLNVLAHFFGLSQTILPTKSFARFMLMMFIMLCFMIRTLYSGMLCDFFQTDLRRIKPIESVADMNRLKYKVFDNGLFSSCFPSFEG
jgi:uncharacterized protein with PQ loop repeat